MDTAGNTAEEIYAPPKAQLEKPGEYYVSGKFIVARSPVKLPQRCVLSGEAGGDLKHLSRSFVDHNPFTISISRKRCHISYSLSLSSFRTLRRRVTVARIVIIGGLAALLFGFRIQGDLGFYLALSGLIIALIGAIASKDALPLKVAKYKDGWFYIEGCSHVFLATAERQQFQFQEQAPSQA